MTYEVFEQQFHAIGQRKGEGYFPFHFEGMTSDERARARAMLEQSAERGDTVDLDGLRLIGDAGTVQRLRQAPLPSVGDIARYEVTRAETLYSLSNDPVDLQPLIGFLNSGDDKARLLAANTLARLRPPALVAAVIASCIDRENDRATLSALTRAWLACHGLDMNNDAVADAELPFRREVAAAPKGRREQVLQAWDISRAVP